MAGELVGPHVAVEDSTGPDHKAYAKTGWILITLVPVGMRGAGAPRERRKPTKATKEVDTSARLWMASPSRPTDPLTRAMTNSIPPVRARPNAESRKARFAAFLCSASRSKAFGGNGSKRCVVPSSCMGVSPLGVEIRPEGEARIFLRVVCKRQ